MSLEKLAEKIPVIFAEGNHYEIGMAHGSQGRERICITLENLKRTVKKNTGHEWDACVRLTRAFLPVVKKMVPEYIDEILGIADGSGLQFEDIFALNCRTELGQQFNHNIGKNVEMALRLIGGCSVIGVNQTRTDAKTTIYGQNWDAPPEQAETLIFVTARQKSMGKPDIAWIGEAGLICRMAGMNSAGIGLGGNSLFTNAPIDFDGLPLQFAYRYIMDQPDFPKAVAAAVKSQVASNINFMICGREGEMVNLEMGYRCYGMIYMKHGVICHANTYRHSKMPEAPYKELKIFPKDELRSFRLEYLVEELQGNKIVKEDLMRILSEHEPNFPVSICQHGEDFATITSTVCDLSLLSMQIAVGSPCQGYMEIRPFEKW